MYVYNNNDVEFIFSICGFISEGGVLWGKGGRQTGFACV